MTTPCTNIRAVNSRCGLAVTLLLVSGIITACQDEGRAQRFDQLAERSLMLRTIARNDDRPLEPLRALPEIDRVSLTEPIIELGRLMFHDRRLSRDGTLNCASCHAIADGGDDGRPHALGIDGQIGPINSPTVLNSGFNFRQFWDGRAASLAQQALGPVEADVEMGDLWPDVVSELQADDALVKKFKAVYGSRGISVETITDAIARFEETLITPAPFDDWLAGNESAISSDASRGYALFKEYGCSSCHQGINVGGNLYQRFGALQSLDLNKPLPEQSTVMATQKNASVELFKVPSLRNVEVTAPYFHTGSVNDLDTAVRIMALSQLGRHLPAEDRRLIVAFLKSLTGDVMPHVALID